MGVGALVGEVKERTLAGACMLQREARGGATIAAAKEWEPPAATNGEVDVRHGSVTGCCLLTTKKGEAPLHTPVWLV